MSPSSFKKLLYGLAITLAGMWTLAMWGAYLLLGLSDEALAAGSRFFAIDTQILEWLTSLVGGTQQVGAALVLIVWLLGVVLIAIGSWLGLRLMGIFGINAGAR